MEDDKGNKRKRDSSPLPPLPKLKPWINYLSLVDEGLTHWRWHSGHPYMDFGGDFRKFNFHRLNNIPLVRVPVPLVKKEKEQPPFDIAKYQSAYCEEEEEEDELGDMVAGELALGMNSSDSTRSEGQDEDNKLIGVRVSDMEVSDPLAPTSKVFGMPQESTCMDLTNMVEKLFVLNQEDFELYFKNMKLSEPTFPLVAIGMIPDKLRNYRVNLFKKKKARVGEMKPVTIRRLIDNGSRALEPEPSTSTDAEYKYGQKDFVGLKNQSMTCYLNSTIQALFFTPEFRNMVLVHKNGTSKICIAFQKLFLTLQLSPRAAIETTVLTDTFGWTMMDVSAQQDVEELWTILMNHLAREFKDNPLDGMIKKLFYGEMRQKINCLACNNIRSKLEEFLVLPLSVLKHDNEPLGNPCLEEAIRQFVAPEVLTEGNQVDCGSCNVKGDAAKSCELVTLPRILAIQLKRFMHRRQGDTWVRCKLYNQIVFPQCLDMNEFVDPNVNAQDGVPEPPALDLIKPPSCDSSRYVHSRNNICLVEVDESLQVPEEPKELSFGSSKERIQAVLNEMLKTGENVYELYGVFVHEGDHRGGHYYCYMKDFETYRWYRCDDVIVKRVNPVDIVATFGNYDPLDKNQATAYMLMYRKYDGCNILPFLQNELPLHIKTIEAAMLEEDKRADDNERTQRESTIMTVVYRHTGEGNKSMEIAIPRSLTTKKAALYCFKQLFPGIIQDNAIENELPLHNIRLTRYDLDRQIIENSWEDEDQYLTYSLRNPPALAKHEGLFLEMKNAGDAGFPVYKPDDFVFETTLTSFESRQFVRSGIFRLSKEATLTELKDALASGWALDSSILRMCLKQGETILFLHDETPRLDQYMNKNNTAELFVEPVLLQHYMAWSDFVYSIAHYKLFEVDIEWLPMSYTGGNGENQFHILEQPDMEWRYNFHDGSYEDRFERSSNSLPSVSTDNDNIPSPDSQAVVEISCNGSSCVAIMNDADKEALPSRNIEERVANSCVTITRCPDRDQESYLRIIVNVDKRQKLIRISEAIADMIKIPYDEFSFFRDNAFGEDEEIMNHEVPINSVLRPDSTIRLKFLRRLKEGEVRLNVFFLDLGNPEDTNELLGTVIIHSKMSLGQLKDAAFLAFGERLKNVNPSNCQFRKKSLTDCISKVMRKDQEVGNWIKLSRDFNIYLQVFNDPVEVMDSETYSFITRIYHPSTWALDKPFEIQVTYEMNGTVEDAVIERLSEVTKIPKEDIEFATVKLLYPFDMTPPEIHDLEWLGFGHQAKKPVYLYCDELVVFMRNKNEVLKPWTLEDEQRFRQQKLKEENYSKTPPQKERGIRLNLNRSQNSIVPEQ